MEANNPEKKLERLSRAIAEAILRSSNVRNALLEVQKENLISENSLIMLMMRVDGLANLANSIQKKKGKGQGTSKKTPDQYIDGKKLSPSEVEFHEFLANNFDEAEWLNKNGLALD